MRRKLSTGFMALAAVALLSGCGGESAQGPATGELTVRAVTTGPAPDPDGYRVSIDGGADLALPASGSITVTGLGVGDHLVRISGWASHCGPDPLSSLVTVQAGTAAEATYTVHCPAIPMPVLHYVVWNSGAGTNGLYRATIPPVRVAPTVPFPAPLSPGLTRLALRAADLSMRTVFIDGTGEVNLTQRMGETGNPLVWSPDGSRLAFSRSGGGFGVVNADGKGLKIYYSAGTSPTSWSPDGRYLLSAWIGQIHGVTTNRLTRLDTETGAVTHLVANAATITSPAYSPDGQWIIYGLGPSAQDTVPSIRKIPAAGGSESILHRSYSSGRRFGDLAWSPSGTQIAFVLGEEISDVGEIWVMPSDGGLATNVTETQWVQEGLPRWPS